jgi:hypothetical protein
MSEHPNALLTRSTGGITVDALYLPSVDLTGIAVRTSEAEFFVTTEKSDLLDAFNHPALYLGPQRCEKLGIR